MFDKNLITAAFERMGPKRVQQGLTAVHHSWSYCFLAKAYPEHSFRCPYDVVEATGLTDVDVLQILAGFDGDTASFRALAAEWLEANYNDRRIHSHTVGASDPAATRVTAVAVS